MSRLSREQLARISKQTSASCRHRNRTAVSSTVALVTYLAFLIGAMVIINLILIPNVKASEDSGYQEEIGYEITA